jgi:hypothetical protein
VSEKNKLGIEELLERIDQLVTVLNSISKDLSEISRTLKAEKEPVTPVERGRIVEGVRALFPEDLERMLTFEETEDCIVIRPRRYLGSEIFAKVASIVRDEGGEYVSAGRESHFRVFKKND